MSALPTFRLNKQTMSNEEFESKIENKARYANPGVHDFKITGVSDQKVNTVDPSWVDIKVELKNSAGELMTTYLKIPTESLTFKSQYPMMAAKELVNFFAAIGEDFSPKTAQVLMTKYIGADFKAKGLIGRTLTATIGFRQAHAKYIEKETYQLVDRDGLQFKLSDTTSVPLFNNHKDVEAYAKENGIKYQKFISILNYAPSESVNQVDEVSDASGDDFNF